MGSAEVVDWLFNVSSPELEELFSGRLRRLLIKIVKPKNTLLIQSTRDVR
jgi:hypothetical protein